MVQRDSQRRNGSDYLFAFDNFHLYAGSVSVPFHGVITGGKLLSRHTCRSRQLQRPLAGCKCARCQKQCRPQYQTLECFREVHDSRLLIFLSRKSVGKRFLGGWLLLFTGLRLPEKSLKCGLGGLAETVWPQGHTVAGNCFHLGRQTESE